MDTKIACFIRMKKPASTIMNKIRQMFMDELGRLTSTHKNNTSMQLPTVEFDAKMAEFKTLIADPDFSANAVRPSLNVDIWTMPDKDGPTLLGVVLDEMTTLCRDGIDATKVSFLKVENSKTYLQSKLMREYLRILIAFPSTDINRVYESTLNRVNQSTTPFEWLGVKAADTDMNGSMCVFKMFLRRHDFRIHAFDEVD